MDDVVDYLAETQLYKSVAEYQLDTIAQLTPAHVDNPFEHLGPHFYPYPSRHDIKLFVYGILLVAVLRWVLHFAVFKPIARVATARRWAAIQKLDAKTGEKQAHTAEDLVANEQFNNHVFKMTESMWKFMYYFTTWAFGMWTVWEDDLFDTQRHLTGWPYHMLTSGLRTYFVISTSFYAYSIVALPFEVRRKDFWELFVHHILTTSIMLTAFWGRLYRIGTVAVLLHDFNDIFLEVGKFLRYLKYEKACDSVFAFFAASWFFTRFYLFYRLLIVRYVWDAFDHFIVPQSWFLVFGVALHMLLALHSYWGFMIVRVAVRSLIGKSVADPREDDDD